MNETIEKIHGCSSIENFITTNINSLVICIFGKYSNYMLVKFREKLVLKI